MNFNFNEEQNILKNMSRYFLAEKYPKSVVKQLEADEKGYSPKLWKEMADLGWMGLVFPEKYGGAGMSFLDLAVLLEEMGRAVVPGPFFSTVILGGLPIMNFGTDKQKQAYLPGIASGEKIFTLALNEADARYDVAPMQVKAIAGKDGYSIFGTKLFVPDAHIANYILCTAHTRGGKAKDEVTVFIVDTKNPGITCTLLKTIAQDKLSEVVFDRVNVPAENILGQLNGGRHLVENIMEHAAVALCCQILGGLQKALEMSVTYAKERVQFNKPIGAFQIIQHYCADMAIDIEGLRFSTYQAAWRISQKLPCAKEVAVAKTWSSQVSERVMTLAHQIHGAMGFTRDHDLHFYTTRIGAATASYGDAHYHKETVAQEMGL